MSEIFTSLLPEPLMKLITPAIVLSLLCANAFAADAAPAIGAIKHGDRITQAVQKYTQEAPSAAPVLEEKISSSTYTVESGAGDELLLRYKSGSAEVFGKDLALIARINKEGERKDIESDTVKHWMPKTELKPGMKWSFENQYEVDSSSSTRTCKYYGEYDAVSSAGEREQKINGTTVKLPVIVVDIRGRVNVQICRNATGSNVEERYVYSKDLNLVLEHSTLRQDAYGKLLGNTNRLLKVTAISTDKNVAALTPAP